MELPWHCRSSPIRDLAPRGRTRRARSTRPDDVGRGGAAGLPSRAASAGRCGAPAHRRRRSRHLPRRRFPRRGRSGGVPAPGQTEFDVIECPSHRCAQLSGNIFDGDHPHGGTARVTDPVSPCDRCSTARARPVPTRRVGRSGRRRSNHGRGGHRCPGRNEPEPGGTVARPIGPTVEQGYRVGCHRPVRHPRAGGHRTHQTPYQRPGGHPRPVRRRPRRRGRSGRPPRCPDTADERDQASRRSTSLRARAAGPSAPSAITEP